MASTFLNGSGLVSETERLLVEQSRRGDRRAFEQIVHATARLVYAKIALEVPDRHRAEDLTQEVFMTAWRHIGDLAEPAALRGWLLAIAASVVADDARWSSRKKRWAPMAAGLEEAADGAAGPVDVAVAKDQKQKALEALRGLPEEYRRVLALRYLAGAGYETISKQLALSNGALRGLLHRGLELLRKRMAE
jgi:RNA polymerase sigma-70 factor, ECF subfamily